MKETQRPESRQLSLKLDVPESTRVPKQPQQPSGGNLVRFPNSAPTTSFQRRVIEQLLRTRVIAK